jgi:hypothetical protein
MTRDEKVAIYVQGLLEKMAKDGSVEGGAMRLTEQGRTVFEKLKTEGFKPTTDEINECMGAVQEANLEFTVTCTIEGWNVGIVPITRTRNGEPPLRGFVPFAEWKEKRDTKERLDPDKLNYDDVFEYEVHHRVFIWFGNVECSRYWPARLYEGKYAWKLDGKGHDEGVLVPFKVMQKLVEMAPDYPLAIEDPDNIPSRMLEPPTPGKRRIDI